MRTPDGYALIQPDERVYHVRGTYWRVSYAGTVYRSDNAGRGWTKQEARDVAAGLSPLVRFDRRNRAQRFQDAGRAKSKGRVTRTRPRD